ncbi:MAG: aromatic amino acid hydroxylase [Oligoflexia bacterium]|nr:aromatic amino acid hydroxylase [Oligoflexia bacterium]
MTENIPEYLLPYVAKQNFDLYTPADHAGWRFILKISKSFFVRHAHRMYLDGLEKTGISSERIPRISEMDEKLRVFGWRAVPVCGFIPPSVFMEFLSLGILPIACDMRQPEHLEYTPAPDIVHEAAGHAPIIADPEYAAYLRRYGEISRKAIHSAQDWEVYLAIRRLSDLKEDPCSRPEEISAAQRSLEEAVAQVDHVSEATQLARMSWWTIEYGLIGDSSAPKIYGAGLLSSVSESYHCLGPGVAKRPLTLDCVRQGYDITRPQPQLFVARDFQELTEVLEQLAATMAFRKGGGEGLHRAWRAGTVTTCQLENGLQISGIVDHFIEEDGVPFCVWHRGRVQLARDDRELEAGGPQFVTLLGRPRRRELGDGRVRLEFGSGLVVEGRAHKTLSIAGRELGRVFSDCSFVWRNRSVESPSGEVLVPDCERIVSVFGGAADRASFLRATGGIGQSPGIPKTNLTDANRELNDLYARVRRLREEAQYGGRDALPEALTEVHRELETRFPEDWLLRYELLELNSHYQLRASWEPVILRGLARIGSLSPARAELIRRGLELV